MQGIFLSAVRTQRSHIRSRWEDLLRAERCTSPLANPDTLVHLLDLTLDELLANLAAAESFPRRHRRTAAECPCGRNPLLIYFGAGRQSTREALVLAQAAMPGLTPHERDTSLEALESAFGQIAEREIEAFCAVCQYRHPDTDGQESAAQTSSAALHGPRKGA